MQPQRAPHGASVHDERHRHEQATLYRLVQDETLGLNCAWYADILMVLSEPRQERDAALAAAPEPTG